MVGLKVTARLKEAPLSVDTRVWSVFSVANQRCLPAEPVCVCVGGFGALTVVTHTCVFCVLSETPSGLLGNQTRLWEAARTAQPFVSLLKPLALPECGDGLCKLELVETTGRPRPAFPLLLLLAVTAASSASDS